MGAAAPYTANAFAEFGGSAEQRHQQRQRGRGDQRGAGALDRAAGDLDADVAGGAGEHASRRQDEPAGDEDLPGPEEVGEPAAEQQQSAEGDDVGVEHPRQRLGGEAELGLHVGEGDADDRRVHDDDELGGGDECEPEPAAFRPGRWLVAT